MKKYFFILIAFIAIAACNNKMSGSSVKETTEVTKEQLAAGHTIYTTKCSKCHDAKDIAAFDIKSWKGILEDMIPKAKLNEEEAKNVTAYVMANAKK